MIVATAGHVDHGKTELVKALTGIDTDRLPEEKVLHTTIKELVIYLSDNKKASKAPAIIIYGPIMKKKKIKK